MKRTTLCGLAITTWLVLVFSFNLTVVSTSSSSDTGTWWQPSHPCIFWNAQHFSHYHTQSEYAPQLYVSYAIVARCDLCSKKQFFDFTLNHQLWWYHTVLFNKTDQVIEKLNQAKIVKSTKIGPLPGVELIRAKYKDEDKDEEKFRERFYPINNFDNKTVRKLMKRYYNRHVSREFCVQLEKWVLSMGPGMNETAIAEAQEIFERLIFKPIDEVYLYGLAATWYDCLQDQRPDLIKTVTNLLISVKGCAQDDGQAEAELISSGELYAFLVEINFWPANRDQTWLQSQYDQLPEELTGSLQDRVLVFNDYLSEAASVLNELIYHRAELDSGESNWNNNKVKLCNVVQAGGYLMQERNTIQSSTDVLADANRYLYRLYGGLLFLSLTDIEEEGEEGSSRGGQAPVECPNVQSQSWVERKAHRRKKLKTATTAPVLEQPSSAKDVHLPSHEITWQPSHWCYLWNLDRYPFYVANAVVTRINQCKLFVSSPTYTYNAPLFDQLDQILIKLYHLKIIKSIAKSRREGLNENDFNSQYIPFRSLNNDSLQRTMAKFYSRVVLDDKTYCEQLWQWIDSIHPGMDDTALAKSQETFRTLIFERLDQLYLYDRAEHWFNCLNPTTTATDIIYNLLISVKGCAQGDGQAEAELISSGELYVFLVEINFWPVNRDQDWFQSQYNQLLDDLTGSLQESVFRVKEPCVGTEAALNELIYRHAGLDGGDSNWRDLTVKLCNVVQAIESLIQEKQKSEGDQSSKDIYHRYFDEIYGKLLLYSLGAKEEAGTVQQHPTVQLPPGQEEPDSVQQPTVQLPPGQEEPDSVQQPTVQLPPGQEEPDSVQQHPTVQLPDQETMSPEYITTTRRSFFDRHRGKFAVAGGVAAAVSVDIAVLGLCYAASQWWQPNNLTIEGLDRIIEKASLPSISALPTLKPATESANPDLWIVILVVTVIVVLCFLLAIGVFLYLKKPWLTGKYRVKSANTTSTRGTGGTYNSTGSNNSQA